MPVQVGGRQPQPLGLTDPSNLCKIAGTVRVRPSCGDEKSGRFLPVCRCIVAEGSSATMQHPNTVESGHPLQAEANRTRNVERRDPSCRPVY